MIFAPFELAEQFLGLLFHLFFFIADVGDHVAEDVERGHAGISRAAHGLHGDGHHGFEAELLVKGRQREHQADRRAVGIGHDVAAGFLAPCLDVDQLDVSAIDFRNDERNVLLHAQCAGVRDHGAAGVGKAGLEFGGDGSIEGGENNFRSAFGSGGRNLHLRDGGRESEF